MEGEDGRKIDNYIEQVINLANVDGNQEVMDQMNTETNGAGHLENVSQSQSEEDQTKTSVSKNWETEQTHRDENLDLSTMTETAQAQNALSGDLSQTDTSGKLLGSSDAENNKAIMMATGKHEHTTKKFRSQTQNTSTGDAGEHGECQACKDDEPRAQEHQPKGKSSKGAPSKEKSLWLVQKCKNVWRKIRKPKQKNQHATSKNKKCSTASEDEMSPDDWYDEEGEEDNEHCSKAEQSDCVGPTVESRQTEQTVEAKEEPSKRVEQSTDLHESTGQSDVCAGSDILQVGTLLLQNSSANVKNVQLKKGTSKVKETVEQKMPASMSNLSKHQKKKIAKQQRKGPNRHQASKQQTRNGRSQNQAPRTSYEHSGDEEEEEEEMEVCEDEQEDATDDKERNEKTERKQKGDAKTPTTEIMETEIAVRKHQPNKGRGSDNTGSRIPVYKRKPGASVVDGENSEQNSSNGSCAQVDPETKKLNQHQQKTQDGCASSGIKQESNLPRQVAQKRRIEVHFHVGLPSECKHPEDQQELCVVFFDLDKPGSRYTLEMHHDRGDLCVFTGHRIFEYDERRNDEVIQYKYSFAKKSQPHDFEHTAGYDKQDKHHNRKLDISQIQQKFGSMCQDSETFIWHQFDGIAKPKQGRVASAFLHLKSLIFSSLDWTNFLGSMLQKIMPSLEGLCEDPVHSSPSIAEEALKEFEHVYFCIQHSFLDEKGYRFDENKAKQLIKRYLLPRMIALENDVSADGNSSLMHKPRVTLATAVSIIQIMLSYKIELEKTWIPVLCQGLLLKPDNEKKTCPEYEELVLVHFKSMNKEINESLLQFVNDKASDATAQWLLAIPLIHFLGKSSKPFETLNNMQAKHDDTKPVWWGEEQFSKAKRNMSAHYFSNYPEVVKKMIPLFEMDFLLPRTLLALMPFRNAVELLKTIKFPVNAALANLCCFMRQCISWNPFEHEWKKKDIGNLVVSVIAQMDEDATAVSSVSEMDCKPNCLEELLLISIDLLGATCNAVHQSNQLYEVVLQALQAFLFALMSLDKHHHLIAAKYPDEVNDDSSMTTENEYAIGKAVLFEWLKTCFQYSLNAPHTRYFVLRYDGELKCIDDLLKLANRIPGETLKDDWIGTIKKHIKSRMNTMNPEVAVSLLSSHDLTKYQSSVIEETILECAIGGVDDFSKNCGMDSMFKLSTNATGMVRLLAKHFDQKWPNSASDDDMLRHVLGWPAFVHFQKSFGKFLYEGSEYLVILESYEVRYTTAISLLDTSVKELLDGTITVALMNILLDQRYQRQLFAILDNLEGGFSIFQAVEKKEQSSLIATVLNWRNKELQEYQCQLKLLHVFMASCRDLKCVDLTPLQSLLEVDMNQMRMVEFCVPRILDSGTTENGSSYHPNISHFLLSNEALEILEKLETLKESQLFIKMWQKYAGRVVLPAKRSDTCDDDSSTYEGRPIVERVCFEDFSQDAEEELGDVECYEDEPQEEEEEEYVDGCSADCDDSVCNRIIGDVVKFVWRPVMQTWNELKTSLMSGRITVERTEKLFGRFHRNYETIRSELELILEDPAEAKQRLEQIELLDQVDATLSGAEVILEAKEKFKIQGDFSDLETLVNLSVRRQHIPLSSISKGLLQSADKLKNISDDKSKCLAVFLKTENKVLADWLKETLPLAELRTFIDIALIVATGEGAVQVEYIVCLDAAVKGYAPFIYQIKDDMSYEEFLQLCSEVWDVLQTDPKLPEKFTQTARNLDFLKQILESHGSVEGNAISKTKCINKSGVYSVGFHENKLFKNRANVISLKYNLEQQNASADPKLSPGDTTRCMDLQQLTDLHNKLMLIVGGDQELKNEVDQFGEIFDGILRLSETYIKLCTAGCTLFHHWRAVFFCCPSKKNKVYMHFSSDGPPLKASEKNVAGQIQDICRYMESCLEEWVKHVEEQREQFCHLNFFTTQQLMILQQELSKIKNDSDEDVVGQKVYALLSLVKNDCSFYDLYYCFSTAVRQLVEQETRTDVLQEHSSEEAPVQHRNEEEDSIRSAFIEAMVDSGFSETLALRALDAGIDPSSPENGTMWCMENEEPDEMMSKCKESSLVREDSVTLETPSDASDQWIWPELQTTSLTSITSGLLHDLVKENDDLKTKLVHLWKGFLGQTTESFTDCLSLKHLGLILKSLALADDENEKRTFERPMPTYLKTSQPNLIVCSKSDVLSVILSIYSFNNGVDLPLPGVDEVLLCSSETTAEDVELLLLRASGHNGKVYSLVYADMLDYDVACQVEDQMRRFFPAVPMQDLLRLVVICCREQEVRSNIVSALDRYRVHVPQFNHNELKTYLKKHFVVKSDGKLGLDSVPASHVDPEQCSIRQIQSYRSGVGKTLRVKRLERALRNKLKLLRNEALVTISIHSKTVDHSKVMKDLLVSTPSENYSHPRIFHLDIAPEVQEGVDHFLFSLLVLGSVTDEDGFVWRRREHDLYVVECMPLMMKDSSGVRPVHRLVHQMFSLLPSITCWSPQDSIDILQDHPQEVKFRHPDCSIGNHDQLIDMKEFESEELQRPFQYLKQYASNQQVQKIRQLTAQGTPQECIQFLLRHCGVLDPSWSELRNFASFLNIQLKDCEQSCYCMDFLAPDLPGFLTFVVKFMIRMSKDFATRSLKISEESPGYASHGHTMLAVGGVEEEEGEEGVEDGSLLQAYSLKRRWEMSPHPYLFFNNDHHSFTFMGFVMDRHTQNLLDPQTNQIIERQIMPQNLHHALYRNKVDLQENFENLKRHLKIEKLCNVMGQEFPYDPDESYELTGDNVKKILAIFMRFRCHIPVIIMGETGCGKTRLVKFMCDLWRSPGEEIENMILMKMHGGTTEKDIMKCLHHAINVSKENKKKNAKFGTVLFFDEANTTEAIGLIKEIMCDHTCNGKPLPDTSGLHLIAACNPYRKHSDLMIERLEQAGLGYRVRADQTRDKLGYIPMRQLVYRVQALPQSMLPLVWDFGQLNDDVESLYIRQMVSRHLKESPELTAIPRLEITLSKILAESQTFMRRQQNECSFVSLRDVDRALKVMMWFYLKGELLFTLMDQKANSCREETAVFDVFDEEFEPYKAPERHTRSLILALGVCYHACLQNRDQYRHHMSRYFLPPCTLNEGPETLLDEINLCQDVFLENVGQLGDDIARNKALKENVFMMVICIELRIPLFLVGKPGSSKSLAKTIVGNAMLGKASVNQLFKEMKSVHMVSFQCSPLSTPEGIIGTFEQCAQLQRDKELDKHVAVVVLDEVGLAEDSPKMPLKTLHPLLEYGCEIDGQVEEYSKVGFIGISNWALDPAKMNRGILVLREVPDEEELLDSAKGICSGEYAVKMTTLMGPLTLAYRELYLKMLSRKQEFFGLRDFYSLIKMVYAFCKKSKKEPTWFELKHAILRNFDGLDDRYVCPLTLFEKHLPQCNKHAERLESDPDCSSSALIQASLHGIGLESESRYLLILTENYVALGLLHQQLEGLKNAITIFGSSFPRDQEYTQVCRNINRIKTCMENGRTVVLLNLENLYESLYDALNQYYMYFNSQRFVDLGLGTQRVKCKVHKDFRLIVVAEKTVVYEKFPIPLINRLEKHILSMETMLTDDQMKLVKKLQSWAEEFCTVNSYSGCVESQPKVGDVFIGYHADAAASVILQLWKQMVPQDEDREASKKIWESAKSILLQCATPDSLIRLSKTNLTWDAENLQNRYFFEQNHSNLADLIQLEISNSNDTKDIVFMQVTTHSLLLSRGDLTELSRVLDIDLKDIHFHSLQGFDTEQQFCSLLRDVFRQSPQVKSSYGVTDTEPSSVNTASRLFLLQCDAGDANPELIACARYNISNEYSHVVESQLELCQQQQIHVVFIIQLPRVPGGCFAGFQGGKWKCYHLDELLPATEYLPKLSTLKKLRISELFCRTIELEGQRGREDPPLFSGEDVKEEEEEEQRTMKEKLEQDESMHEERLDSTDRITEDYHHEMREINEDLLKFNVDRLILNCLHRAAALLKDSEKDHNLKKMELGSGDKFELQNRKIHRLNLLLKLLRECNGEQDGLSLMSVIKRRLGRLLRDKETATQMPEQVGSWLTNEVSTIETTAKAGTFRRALLQTLESKVTPLLSGIIAYTDRNANLDLLEKKSPWQQKVWLEMLNEEEVTLFRYRDLNSPEHRTETGLPEYQVTNTGCDGSFFECSFPFSFVIKEQIDLLLHQTRQSGEEMKVLVALLEQTDLGKVLTKSVSPETKSDMIDAYIKDFAQMIYKSSCSTEAELKWVIDDLKRTMSLYEETTCDENTCDEETSCEDSAEASLVACFVNLHLAHEVVRPRLLLFSELLRIWPESIQFIASDKDISLPLDIKMLFLLLEHLVSEAKQLDDSPRNQRDWLAKTDRFRPLIEQLLESISVNADDLSQSPFFRQCCQMWNRVLTVQLFIKRVCLPRTTEASSLVARKCKRLFMLLGENANLKEIKSFKALEAFLQHCNKEAIEYYIGLGKCGHCANSISDPVELPCSHTMCLKCAVELKQIGMTICPREDCNKTFPKDLRLSPLGGKSKEVVAHNEYRKHLNSFLMEVIYSLCFLRNSPPSEEVVQKLMEYVTLGAKETFEEKADPSPVVRSFVLQVLLQSENENIRSYLDDYFKKASTVLKSTSEEIAELCVLVVNCLEDYYRSVSSMKSTLPDQIQFVLDILKATGQCPLRIDETPNAATLESFGKIRFVLNQTATWIHKTHILKHKDLHMNDIGNLLQRLGKYLENSESKWPRVYLMRVICNNYGLEILKQLAAAPCFHWIMSPEGKEEMEGMKKPPDRFLTYGNSYTSIRDLICRITLGSTTEELTYALHDLEKKDKHCGRLVLLAIYRNVTLNYHYLEENQKTSDETKKTLMEFCKSNPYIKKQEDLPEELIENRLPGSLLVVSPGQTTRQLTLAELITHFYIVMFTIRKRKLHSPFVSLIFTPVELQNSLFPTMPQDDLQRLQLVIAQKDKAVVYKCPNGHPYVIGDCGNPNFVRNCPSCGAEIGGLQHVVRPGNVRVDQITDETRRGHCLGPANLRSDDPTPERDLSPASTMIMRLMLHMSMYLASSAHTQDVCSLMSPTIPENMLEKYLHHHIITDLRDIGKALGRNEDDVILLIHLLLHHLTSTKTTKSGPQGLPVLATKEQRQEWENIYDRTYITPVLLKMLNGPRISEIQQTIRDDDCLLGNSQLIRLLYEVDRPLSSGDGEMVENTSHLWRFRAQISLENLSHQLNDNIPENQNQNAILKLFLREYWRLRYVRYLPSIMKLNRLMKQHLIQQADKEAAAKWTAKSDEFKNSFSGPHLFKEVVDLISDFEVVWKSIRQNLSSFVFARGLRLSEEQCGQSVDQDTKVITFVASGRGDGLRSLAVVSYLCDVQNQFMEEYSRLTGQSLEISVDVSEASSAQMITLHEQQDILPVLLANCTYSLKAGEGTTIRYDFSALEKQIEERFIRGKSRLQPYQVDQLSMLDDVSYAKLFEQLRQRIHQEPLPSQMKSELDEMKKNYSALNELLSDLDTALGYLAFIGGKPNVTVHHFMTTVLRMKPKLKSTKVQGICLKHFESLWLSVAFMKARHALMFKLNPFEAVEEIYKEELTEAMVEKLMQSLQGKRDVDVLVLSLFECILFQMTVKHSDSGTADNSNEELGLILDAYIEQKASTSGDWQIPPEIKVKHCISTWKHLVTFRPTNTRR